MIAGTILPDKLNTLMVKGVQFDGIVLNEPGPLTDIVLFTGSHNLSNLVHFRSQLIDKDGLY